MFTMTMSIGPVTVQVETDERLSFDAIDSILNRGAATTLTLFDEHLSAMIKYESYADELDCEECAANEELE